MIVQPDLVTHPKFIRLKLLVGPGAMEYLVRLWGHCQSNQRGAWWPGCGAEYVENVVAGRSKLKKVYAALKACGFVEEDSGGVLIHDWDVHNSGIVSRWNRGGRKFAQVPEKTRSQRSAHGGGQGSCGSVGSGPDGAVDGSVQVGAGNGCGGVGDGAVGGCAGSEHPSAQKGLDRIGEECVHTRDSEVEIPSKQEVSTWAEMSCVAPRFAVDRWQRLTEEHGWVKNGRLIDWRHRILRWWTAYGREWLAREKKTAPEADKKNAARREEIMALLLADPACDGNEALREELQRLV